MEALLEAVCSNGPISYATYIETVLYAPEVGYYTHPHGRVGRSMDRDFYTAESLGPVFARLVVAAARELLGEHIEPGQTGFWEVGAEPGAGLLESLDPHPFSFCRVLRPGDGLNVSGKSVLFANEWLDALPFHRLCFEGGRWRELGVSRARCGLLREVILEDFSEPVASVAARLPAEAQEGYRLDLPLAAEAALAELLRSEWTGLLLLFDYGKTWQRLINECPEGTARTYYRHQAGGDLLANPGKRDITCDLCWDALEDVLRAGGLESITLETQEAFFVKRAERAVERIVTQSGGGFSRERQTLMELLHPAHMGRRFQVLWGLRLS